MKKKILWGLLIVLVVIQFIRPAKNQSTTVAANDIVNHYPVPDTVRGILQRACNDCHSNNTEYPWYTNIQPVGWWLQHHVNEGKHSLNFSAFASYEKKDQHHVLHELIEEIKEDHMPLNSYLWIHKDAKLSVNDKKLLTDWANAVRSEIASKYNVSGE